MSKADAAALVNGVHGKLSDTKIQPHAYEMLSCLSEVWATAALLHSGCQGAT